MFDVLLSDITTPSRASYTKSTTVLQGDMVHSMGSTFGKNWWHEVHILFDLGFSVLLQSLARRCRKHNMDVMLSGIFFCNFATFSDYIYWLAHAYGHHKKTRRSLLLFVPSSGLFRFGDSLYGHIKEAFMPILLVKTLLPWNGWDWISQLSFVKCKGFAACWGHEKRSHIL